MNTHKIPLKNCQILLFIVILNFNNQANSNSKCKVKAKNLSYLRLFSKSTDICLRSKASSCIYWYNFPQSTAYCLTLIPNWPFTKFLVWQG